MPTRSAVKLDAAGGGLAAASRTVPIRVRGGVRVGMTLVEVSVALLILALAVMLAIPALPTPGRAESTFAAVVDGARRTAIRRAQALTLDVDSAGGWRLLASDGTSAGHGEIRPALPGLRLRLTPMGGCLLESGPEAFAVRWDAARCAETEDAHR